MITKSYMTSRIQKTYLALVAVSVLVGVGLVMSPLQKVQAAPATFVVTNTNDSGAGSLRQAIVDANTNGNPSEQDIIEFNIPSSGNVTIQPQTTMTIGQSVLIDGYSQSDATPNTNLSPEPFNSVLRVEIDNSVAGAITITGDNVTLQGLVINGGPTGNIDVSAADNFGLFGSYIDTKHNGLVRQKGATDSGSIEITDSANAMIGDEAANQRNILGFCSEQCILAQGSATTNLSIQGNYIGLGSDGITSLESYQVGGTALTTQNNVTGVTIGGTVQGEGNVIERNYRGALLLQDTSDISILGNRILFNFLRDAYGTAGVNGGIYLGGVEDVVIGSTATYGPNIISGTNQGGIVIENSPIDDTASTNIMIESNYIGVMDDGTTAFPNTEGIAVNGSTQNVHIKGNAIREATQTSGIIVNDSAQNIAITENSIYNNDELGIDIYGDGTTSNDATDSDTGPNDTLNFPDDITFEETEDNTTVIRYNLDVPAGEYRVEFFSNTELDSSNYGEGEVFLDYQHITHTGSGEEAFEITLPGIGIENITSTTTEIDESTPSGFGATSEFSTTPTEYIPPPPPPPPDPVTDVSSNITLLNPEDVAIGANLEYEISFTNNGPDSIDIGDFVGLNPGVDTIFIPVLSSDITFISNAGGNITCSSLGAGSASLFGPALGSHSDFEIVMCGYQGGSTILDSGESISTVVTVQVTAESDLEFEVYNMGATPEFDQDLEYVISVGLSGEDVIDLYLAEYGYAPNNFSMSLYPLIDINTEKVLLEPEETQDSTLNYEFTLTNDGSQPVDLAQFDTSGINPLFTSLLVDTLPPGLSYVSVDDENVGCTWLGEGSVGDVASALFENHTDYGLILCAYTQSFVLGVGESFSFNMEVEVTGDPGNSFTNYALGPGLGIISDPDYLNLRRALAISVGDAGYDMIDYLSVNDSASFASAEFTSTENPEETENQPDDSENDSGTNADNNLANTGAGRAFIIVLAGTLIGLSVIALSIYLLRRDSQKIS